MVVNNLMKNVAVSQRIVRDLTSRMPGRDACGCGSALSSAIITAPDRIPPEIKQSLGPLVGKYV